MSTRGGSEGSLGERWIGVPQLPLQLCAAPQHVALVVVMAEVLSSEVAVDALRVEQRLRRTHLDGIYFEVRLDAPAVSDEAMTELGEKGVSLAVWYGHSSVLG